MRVRVSEVLGGGKKEKWGVGVLPRGSLREFRNLDRGSSLVKIGDQNEISLQL